MVELNVPDCQSIYTIAWKPDLSLLLVSLKSGSLLKYPADLTAPVTCHLNSKLDYLVWHPDACATSGEYAQTFAAVQKTTVIVFDFNIQVSECWVPRSKSAKSSFQAECVDDQVVSKFLNKRKINGLQWSPHAQNLLVIIDDDGVAQVPDNRF